MFSYFKMQFKYCISIIVNITITYWSYKIIFLENNYLIFVRNLQT